MALIHPFRKLVQHWMLAKHETVLLVWLKSSQEFPSAIYRGNSIKGILYIEARALVFRPVNIENEHRPRLTNLFCPGISAHWADIMPELNVRWSNMGTIRAFGANYRA